jgi:2-polyprenyl-3-methyl-5-hydroxy-6-metoxy-1,4-benzoquinol methylase
MKLKKLLNPVSIIRDYRELKADVRRLKDRVLELEVSRNPIDLWLYKNREERMDASRKDIFDSVRAEFHLARYAFAAKYVAEKRVLDAACGTGYGTEILKVAGAAGSVLGIDLDEEAIEYARNRHQPSGVSYIASNAARIEAPAGSFEVITSFETIEHVPDDLLLLQEFARLLKPGGTLIISTPNAWPLSLAKYHVREYNRDSFLLTLGKYLSVVEMYNQNSGSDWEHNHKKPAGICKTTEENARTAECFIAVCRK